MKHFSFPSLLKTDISGQRQHAGRARLVATLVLASAVSLRFTLVCGYRDCVITEKLILSMMLPADHETTQTSPLPGTEQGQGS